MPAGVTKRCTYEHCDSQGQSSRFYKIEGRMTSRGHDFSSIAGSVLCKTCYDRFRRRGTLERKKNKPLAVSARRCAYAGCDSPRKGTRFHLIEKGRTSGGQDWSSLVGYVLCKKCYDRYRARGTLERTVNLPLPMSARRCTYEYCDSPARSRHFYKIEKGKTSGGQDWSSVAGSVLCTACYNRFSRTGSLHRTDSRPSKRRTTSEIPQQQQDHDEQLKPLPPPLRSSISPGASISDDEDGTSEQEHEENACDCMECLGGIVPCKRFGLYRGCGDDDPFGEGGCSQRDDDHKGEN